MLLDIYRDQDLAKILIVEHRRDIRTLSTQDLTFQDGLKLDREIDADFQDMPMGLDKGQVLNAITTKGYYAGRLQATIQEVDS